MRAHAFSLERIAGWRRPVAALLIALLGFWSVAAAAAPHDPASGLEICRDQSDDGAGSADAATHYGATCLLCLPGCAALSAADAAPALSARRLADVPLRLRGEAAPRDARIAAAHRPRGPPA